MQALEIWKAVVEDKVDFLEQLIGLLDQTGVRYCVIGGYGVNAYVEPLLTLDLDLVVATDQIETVESLLGGRFRVQRYPHSINISAPGSNLRVQVQTDPRYSEFLNRAETKTVLGLELPVASAEDVLRGKVWAAQDPERRTSKRRKDLLDIERLLESRPSLRNRVPAEILNKLAEL